jgi:hypothetical protein
MAMSDLTTYRLPYNGLPEKQADIDRVKELIIDVGGSLDTRLQAIADGVAGYAFVQGGLSGAMYLCDKDEAEYALIPVDLLDALTQENNDE